MVDLSRNRLVLASSSQTRRKVLNDAGVAIDLVPPATDEGAVIDALSIDGDRPPPADVAAILAEAKAQSVSAAMPGRLVIGADQTLELEGALFRKAEDLAGAIMTLRQLRARTHALHSAVALALDGETVWSTLETAWLTVRDFSDTFLRAYVDEVGEDVLGSVGCYRIEGPGVQLFSRIEGDVFTIQGLPLIPLMDELRRRDLLVA
ncbi:Septum formation protein Maf [Lutibaculum baratangense AMV1]|uniref:Nucleoside triphosphate pyrophosphatase n=1 Tax=Lutibaculum baratangense AMV1 TaxID=631454 RepID=V4RSE1_9HYPH|nr:Maf family protein [Lutibaculum baratangense]ESR26055.1 Septum formation protein Maf [Lutibaculum baratangense AMV1]